MNINYVDISNQRLTGIGHRFVSSMKNTMTVAGGAHDKNDAVVMDLSSIGQLKAKNRMEQENQIIQSDKTFDGQNERTMQDIMNDVYNGVEISEDEKKAVEQELENLLCSKYSEMKEFKLNLGDESVLKELKNNYLMKQRTLQDLQERIEAQKLEDEQNKQESDQTQNMKEVADKRDEVKMLQQSVGLDEEKETQNEDDEKNVQEVRVDTPEEPSLDQTTLKQTIKFMQKNDENIKKLDEHKEKATITEKEYDYALDQVFERIKAGFGDEGFSLLEKLQSYDQFVEDSKELAIRREIARNQKMFDYEAGVDIKLASLTNRNISLAEIMLGKKVQASTGQEL